MKSRSRRAIYCRIVTQIIKRINRGTPPWEVPWRGGDDHPRNGLTGRYYSGLNALILWSAAYNRGHEEHRWFTTRQAALKGGRVRQGEHPTTIYVGGRYHTKAGDRAAMQRNEHGPGRGFQKQYLLFNVSQVEGLPPPRSPPPSSPDHVSPRLQALLVATGADIRVGGRRAYFDADADYVQLPDRERFYDPRDLGDYGRSSLHELSHFVMARSRMNVRLRGDTELQRYAWGELIAELSSAFASKYLGVIPTAEPALYLAEWLATLKAEPELLLEIAPIAARVANRILSFDPGP